MYSSIYKKEIDILFDIALEKGMSRKSILSDDRDRGLVKARRMIMVILKKHINSLSEEIPSPKEISQIVNRDRTTFIYHERVHKNEYEYQDYKEEFDNFLNKFEEILSKPLV